MRLDSWLTDSTFAHRMIRMLNGQHHLDEIRHRASLSRKDLRLVLSAFDEHLITFTHP